MAALVHYVIALSTLFTCWLDTSTPGSRQVSVWQGIPRRTSCRPVRWCQASSQTQASITDTSHASLTRVYALHAHHTM